MLESEDHGHDVVEKDELIKGTDCMEREYFGGLLDDEK